MWVQFEISGAGFDVEHDARSLCMVSHFLPDCNLSLSPCSANLSSYPRF